MKRNGPTHTLLLTLEYNTTEINPSPKLDSWRHSKFHLFTKEKRPPIRKSLL